MARFEDDKRAAMAKWDHKKRHMLRGDRPGGRGYVDPEIVPLCDALNALPGVFTEQSCAGHAETAGSGAYSGNLWLRLDRYMELRFARAVHRLAVDPLIERVERIYWGGGRETVSISFKGLEAGRLDDSISYIRTFFEVLAEAGAQRPPGGDGAR